MLIYLIAAIEALAYLTSVPVSVAFCLDSRKGLGIGAGAFRSGAALRRAKRHMSAQPKPPKGRKGGFARAVRLLKRLRLRSLSLRGEVTLGDAAATALACGALRALSPSIGIRAARVTVDISPRFDGKGPAVAIAGMIEARAGQIILAAARSGMDYLSGRIAPWTDIRSKAS